MTPTEFAVAYGHVANIVNAWEALGGRRDCTYCDKYDALIGVFSDEAEAAKAVAAHCGLLRELPADYVIEWELVWAEQPDCIRRHISAVKMDRLIYVFRSDAV